MTEIERCINSNGATFLIALKRHTGWGKKRIEDFLKTLNSVMDEFHHYCVDDVFEYMAEKELAEVGMDLQQLIPKPLPFKAQMRKSKLEKSPDVTIREVKKLHEEMKNIHGYFESQKENDK